MSSASHPPRLYLGVMISSTFTDLEHHRAALIKAVSGQGFTAVAMENDSAKPDVDVIDSSLQMVRDASAYVGLISHKYGQTPVSPDRNPNAVSITELEFDEAQHLERPILLFIMGDAHPVRKGDVETNAAKIEKLNAFRERAKKMRPDSQVHRVYATFDSIEEFTEKAIHAVAGLRHYFDQRTPAAQAVPLPQPPPTAVLVPNERPPAAKKFFGRRTDLESLIQRLAARENTAIVGPAGMGKTALAAEALRAVVGQTAKSLGESPYSGGVVYLDLYAMHGAIETALETLANKLAGPAFMERSPARDRAAAACQGRSILIVIEGGEEADPRRGREHIDGLRDALAPENRWLLLTRLRTQAPAADSLFLDDSLSAEDAGKLFDSLTQGRVQAEVRRQTLELLAGHPLALTWAGNLLALGDESPEYLVRDWSAAKLPSLNDPKTAQHTLEWLFERSVRGLNDSESYALTAAGLLAHAPFPVQAIDAALHGSDSTGEKITREALRALAQRGLIRVTSDDRRQFTHVLGYRFARKETGSDAGLRANLGTWLYECFAKELGVGAAQSNPAAIGILLEHLAALLRADEDQTLWNPLVWSVLYRSSERLIDLGRLSQARMAFDALAAWFERFSPARQEEPYWLREFAELGRRTGDVLFEQGDLAGAQAYYSHALKVHEHLVASDPENSGWRRDLWVSHDKLGNVLMAQEDLVGAQAAYQQSLEVSQKLADAEPSNMGRQRDLGVTLTKIGDVLLALDDLPGAEGAYQRALSIDQRLSASNPSNTEWQRDMSVSLDRVGNVLLKQNDRVGAKDFYLQSLDVRRRLAASDPSSAVWQRDLSVSLTKMAQIHEGEGDRVQALNFAEESLDIDERLSALDPTNATWQRDVRFSRALIARLQAQPDSD
ncbi:MAG: DUF4062 domain-containing protein [Silvibacterium sp.]|nr:DUF4062 domain-containing protein [Silvibacterium sp.]